MVTVDAILLGGGIGTRFTDTAITSRRAVPKQFQMLGEVPVFIHALQTLLDLGCFRQFIITAPKEFIGLAQQQIRTYLRNPSELPVRVIAGGERRQDSSRLALQCLEDNGMAAPTRVLIHDACRPYLSEELLVQIKNSVFDRSYGAWVPTIPVVETLKKVKDQEVVETVDRSIVHRVQTPQVFEFSLIRSLIDRSKDFAELNFTDDASLCEYYGIPVGVFKGDIRNIKLTYDFELETLLGVMSEAKKGKPCAQESDSISTV